MEGKRVSRDRSEFKESVYGRGEWMGESQSHWECYR